MEGDPWSHLWGPLRTLLGPGSPRAPVLQSQELLGRPQANLRAPLCLQAGQRWAVPGGWGRSQRCWGEASLIYEASRDGTTWQGGHARQTLRDKSPEVCKRCKQLGAGTPALPYQPETPRLGKGEAHISDGRKPHGLPRPGLAPSPVSLDPLFHVIISTVPNSASSLKANLVSEFSLGPSGKSSEFSFRGHRHYTRPGHPTSHLDHRFHLPDLIVSLCCWVPAAFRMIPKSLSLDMSPS